MSDTNHVDYVSLPSVVSENGTKTHEGVIA